MTDSGLRYFVGPGYKPNGPNDTRKVGDEIPEAAQWNSLDVWIQQGAVVEMRVAPPAPPAPAGDAPPDPEVLAPRPPDPPVEEVLEDAPEGEDPYDAVKAAIDAAKTTADLDLLEIPDGLTRGQRGSVTKRIKERREEITEALTESDDAEMERAVNAAASANRVADYEW